MTTPRYPQGCSEWSQVFGVASPVASLPDYAWCVYFYNGNVNNYNRNNKCRVRAVRAASQCQGVSFRSLCEAWERARRHKVPSRNQLAFESSLIDNLLDLEQRVAAGTWKPSPTTCFVRLCSLAAGIDFLGYVVFPTHTRVRRRVVAHAREALTQWAADHVRHRSIRATPAALHQVQSMWGSYEGHFKHADAWRLREGMMQRFPWLHAALRRRKFDYHDDQIKTISTNRSRNRI